MTYMLLRDPEDWHQEENIVQRAINSTYQNSIYISPFGLLTGTKQKLRDFNIVKVLKEEN